MPYRMRRRGDRSLAAAATAPVLAAATLALAGGQVAQASAPRTAVTGW